MAPVELEIGCGNGEYLAQRAGEVPEHDFVGIELLWGRVKKTLRKLALAERDNARLLYGEASAILNYLVPQRSLDLGRIGSFDRKDVELLPGRYTLVGQRAGFRDVRREIILVPGRDAPTVVIRCEEPI